METQDFNNMQSDFKEDRFTRREQRREQRRQYMMRHPHNNGLAGLVLIIIGVIYLLNQLNLGIPDYVFSWKTLLIAIGIFVGAKHNFRGGGWLIPILIGSYFLMIENVAWDFPIRRYAIPIGIILLGLFVMFKSKRKHHKYECVDEQISDEDAIDVTNVFGGSKRTVLSKNFKGGRISCVFGGVDLNFTQADFEGTIYMDIENVFGGTKMLVPTNWEVKVETVSIFGGVNDKRPIMAGAETPTKILIIRGSNIFGGIDIKSY